MTTSVKRGQQWERLLDQSFARLQHSSITRVPAPVKYLRPYTGRTAGKGHFIACYESRGTCDYEGFYRELACTFDAKRTSGSRWDFSAIAEHQLDRMMLYSQSGHLGGVLLWWDCGDHSVAFFGIDVAFIVRTIHGGRKSVRPEHLLAACDKDGSGVRRLPIAPWGVHLHKFFDTLCNDRRES